MIKAKGFTFSYQQVIALGFAALILLLGFLLMLPISSSDGTWTDPLTALFTITSGVCVTGLIVVDTATHWSTVGQLVILVGIQIGGLGIMTVATLVSLMLRRRIGLKERNLLQESVSGMSIGGIVRLTRKILLGTLIVEGTGAVLLATRFVPIFGWAKGVYYGIFHSISGFCNAGFDLMGTYSGQYSSLVSFIGDPVVSLTICALILVGGLGFFVWDDLTKCGFHFRHYQLHTKLAVLLSLSLTIIPAALFLISERGYTLESLSWGEKLLASLFAAVTPRTAGFNTVDTAAMSSGSKLMTMVLMLIGGNPGSTAGGMKTTTMLVVCLSARAMIFHHQDVNVFGRRIEPDTVRRAGSVATVYVLLSLVAALAILMLQPDFAVTDILFEVLSAVNTVGMTTGVTRSLSTVSKLIIMALMFCGRIGSMTFALMFTERKRSVPVQFPVEKILVG